MNPKLIIKHILCATVFRAGYVRRQIARQAPDHVAILMYHRIIDPEEVPEALQPGMYVRPDTFRQHLGFLKANFDVVPLETLADGRGAAKPRCALTFDDGWYDFYRHAFPILKAEHLPATVFLPTDFMSGGQKFWTDRVAQLMAQQRRPALSSDKRLDAQTRDIVKRLADLAGSLNERLETAIAILKPYHARQVETWLSHIEQAWSVDTARTDRSFVDWKEVRQMAAAGNIAFGSHTAGHHILTTLEAGEVRYELQKSMRALREEGAVKDGRDIWFCYPNGNHNDAICGMVAEAGYTAAVTTLRDWHWTGADPFRIRRIPVHQDMTATPAMLGCRIMGWI
jgi:peptidoglycan/xylan/chitin deacetylase (PgdA/CDA1 family)